MQQPGGAGPQLSPDGRYWWDGRAWVPVSGPAGRRGRRWPWFTLGAAAMLLAVGVCAAAATGSHAGASRGAAPGAGAPACAAPCASLGGWSVHAGRLQYDADPGSGLQRPEPGNVYVTVDVKFANRTGREQHADAFQFVLRDGSGVKHPLVWLAGCPAWQGVNLTPGSTYGPKCVAFQAAAGQPAGLVLVWTPGLGAGDHEIRLG
jgi:hypothetical protein